MQRLSGSNVVSTISNAVDAFKAANQRLNNKIKGTFIENWILYWKTVSNDYKDVAVSLAQDAKKKPLKALTVSAGIGLFGISLATNPDEQSFRAKSILSSNNVLLINRNMANPTAVNYLRYLERSYNTDVLRFKSFGLFSVVWVDNYSNKCDIYENRCNYLSWRITEFPKHIVDVGFWNIWWVTSRKLLDYDINEADIL